MSESAISIRGVSKSFGSTRAVRDLDLDVPAGSLCGFLGPNGAGKSTTIRMIVSMIYPDSGSITVLGGSALANKDRIGFLPEERGLYRKMRVGEFLTYIARLKGMRGGAAVRALVGQWLDRVELSGVFDRRCQELSKGMQQKVQFLAAIIHSPDLIILDEPFSGLDPVNVVVISRVVRELNSTGRTVIFSTHVLQQAEELCNRIFLINHGRKLLDSSLTEIRQRFDPRSLMADPMGNHVDFSTIEGVRTSRRIEGADSYELTLDEQVDPQAVMRTILSRYPMRAIELRRPTLTDVFVRLVMADEGVAAAAQAREELSHV
jgi:ABC-2 type transport system ATP-binding protein